MAVSKFFRELYDLVLLVLLHCVESENVNGLRAFLLWYESVSIQFQKENRNLLRNRGIDEEMKQGKKNVEAMIRYKLEGTVNFLSIYFLFV